MEPEGLLVGQLELDNGLTLRFFDQSRSVAGDRCQVRLLAHVSIEVEEPFFDTIPASGEAFRSFSAAVGSVIAFEQVKVRNFVDERDADAALTQMKEEFLKSNRGYLSKGEFPRRYVLKRYAEWKQGEASRIAHQKAVREVDAQSDD